jgi:hypothetical protein
MIKNIVWRDRPHQNGNGIYGTYYGKPSLESANETLDES